jgi:PAS domain S-box-containing protein
MKSNPGAASKKPAFGHNQSIMAAAVRDADWSRSPLGPIDTWPEILKGMVGIVLDSPGIRVLLWGPELIFFYNDGYIPLLDSRPNDGIGKRYADFRPDMWPTLRPFVEAARNGVGQIVTHLRTVLRRNGSEETAYFTLAFTPVYGRDGAIAGVLSEIVEITAQVELRDALQAENRRFRELFDQAPVFLALMETPDLRFIYVNSAYERLIGGRDVVGRTAAEALPELEAQGFIKLLNKVYQSGESLIGRDTLCQIRNQSDGSEEQFYLDFIYQPIVDSGGNVTGILCVGSNVTERHVGKEEAERLRGKLHHASRISAMGTMAATIAHELNQPLTAAGNYLAGSQRIAGALVGPDKAALQSTLKRAEEQISRAAHLIRQARNIAIIGSTPRKTVSVKELVERSLELVEVTRGCTNVEFQTSLGPDAIMLRVDPIQVEQVLLNLVRNACEAMSDCPRRELLISSRKLDNGFAEILVRDTGRGLPRDADEDMFAAFTTSTTGGLGIGLSLSRTLVEAHGGSLCADDNPGVGASLRLTLPLAGELDLAA